MPTFSQKSLDKLKTCEADLQVLFQEVVKEIDCVILEGFRDAAAQNKAFQEGKSQLKWPKGKHNKNPSYAVDVVPYPIDWNDTERFNQFAKHVLATAKKLHKMGKMQKELLWGGSWKTLKDLVHFELK